MAPVGRPRKAGERYLNGRLKGIDLIAITHRRPTRVFHNKSEEETAIYVICAGSVIKIGRSKNPARRAADIQVGQDQEVRVFWWCD